MTDGAQSEHFQSAQIAIEYMDEFMGAVAALKEVTDNAMAKVIDATGNTKSEAGQAALKALAEVQANRIDELFGFGSTIIVELTAYQNGI